MWAKCAVCHKEFNADVITFKIADKSPVCSPCCVKQVDNLQSQLDQTVGMIKEAVSWINDDFKGYGSADIFQLDKFIEDTGDKFEKWLKKQGLLNKEEEKQCENQQG